MTEDSDIMDAMKKAAAKETPEKIVVETGVVRWDELNEAAAEDVGLSPFDWLDEQDELQTAISTARRRIIMPDMEDLLHCAKVREVGKDNRGNDVWGAYFPHTVITDILNKAFGMRWRIIELGREIAEHPISSKHPSTGEEMWRKEAWLWGRLEVWDKDGNVVITQNCDGSMPFKGRAQSIGQVFEGARSNMIRKAATRINPHLGMADPRFAEKVLWYHEVQQKPVRDTWLNLYTVLGVDDKKEVLPKLKALGITVENWELDSKTRLEYLALEARRRKH